jgi:rare lipoprotein A
MTFRKVNNIKALVETVSVLACFLLVSCSAPSYKTDPAQVGYTQFGKASYYAMKFQFRTTASGESFNNYAMTAAHKKLAFGTKVRVINTRNNASVIVRINDRGPFVKGRIIDLSRAAFDVIANLDSGVINVKIEVIR